MFALMTELPMKSINAFVLPPAHKGEPTFVPASAISWKLLFLIRVLLMKSTKVTELPQSGEGTMHEAPRLRTKVEPHLYQFLRFYGNCDF